MSKVAKMRETREAQARSARLKELEGKVEKSAKAIWEMAEALREIREDELWTETHSSWAEYCEDRWAITKRWANSTIEAVEVRKQLAGGNPGSHLPSHVSQAARLARVPEKDRAKVWQAAIAKAESEGKETPSKHRHIDGAIREYNQKRASPASSPTKAQFAIRAAHDMRDAAERFEAEVRRLMPEIKRLPDDEAQACAYQIVKTVHVVMSALQENELVRADVAMAVMDHTRDGREIVVA